MFDPRYAERWNLIRKTLGPVLRVLIDIKATGIENIPPDRPFILVSNHRSDMDPWVIGATMTRYITWLSDEFAFHIPVMGWMMKETGAIAISQDRATLISAYKHAKSVIEAGHVVGIFPEGHDTIVRGAQHLDLGTFHHGFAEYALRFQVDVLPVTILPRKEVRQPVFIPDFLKKMLNMPDDVTHTEDRLIYRRVHVHYGEPVTISRFLPSDTGKDSMKNAITALTNHVHGIIRKRMHDFRERGFLQARK